MSFSLYAIAANLIYHCVLASKSRQTKPRCSSSDKKKKGSQSLVLFSSSYGMSRGLWIAFSLRFVHFPPVWHCAARFVFLPLPRHFFYLVLYDTHTHTHTMQTPWVKVLALFSFLSCFCVQGFLRIVCEVWVLIEALCGAGDTLKCSYISSHLKNESLLFAPQDQYP